MMRRLEYRDRINRIVSRSLAKVGMIPRKMKLIINKVSVYGVYEDF